MWRAVGVVCLYAMGLMLGGARVAAADPGVLDHEVVVGMSNALSGPASALGTGMKTGTMVYLDRVNRAGGIHGRKIRLISYDDGYEPKNTVANTKKLVYNDQVFALLGYVGTPTSKAVIPLVSREKIPFFGPFTGAEFLRNPINRYIFNVRDSYFDEAEVQVQYLTERLGIKRIGLFLQNDSYGLAVKGGIYKALKQRNLSLVAEGRYERNTEEVDAGLAALKKANPEAVTMVGTYKAMAAFIKKARASGFNPIFLNVSFVGTDALIRELGKAGDGVIITQVVPPPYDRSLPLVGQYQDDMRKAGHPTFDFVTLEGYLNARVFVEVLKRAGRGLTRDAFIRAAEGLTLNIQGLNFQFSPQDHQALKKVYITRIAEGRAVLVK